MLASNSTESTARPAPQAPSQLEAMGPAKPALAVAPVPLSMDSAHPAMLVSGWWALSASLVITELFQLEATSAALLATANASTAPRPPAFAPPATPDSSP